MSHEYQLAFLQFACKADVRTQSNKILKNENHQIVITEPLSTKNLYPFPNCNQHPKGYWVILLGERNLKRSFLTTLSFLTSLSGYLAKDSERSCHYQYASVLAPIKWQLALYAYHEVKIVSEGYQYQVCLGNNIYCKVQRVYWSAGICAVQIIYYYKTK